MPKGAGVVRYDGKRGTVWRIKYTDAGGTQVMETLGSDRDGWTERRAEAELRDRLVRVEKRGWRRPAPLTFGQVATRWHDEEQTRRRWKSSTREQYRSVLARLDDAFGKMAIAAIRPRDVSAYVTAMLEADYAPSTVNRDLSILHSILSWAVVQEMCERNAAAGVPRPRVVQRAGRSLAPHDVQRLLRVFPEGRLRAAFLAFVLTGLRREELLKLRWRHVDLIDNVLRVEDAKTDTGIRAVALSPALAEELWQLRRSSPFQGDDEYVFAHPQSGKALSYETFRDALEAACESTGIAMPARPCHDLRVTAITNDAIAGAHPVALMTKAGHRSMETTRRYLKLAGVVFRDEADALEQRLLGTAHGEGVESSTHLT